MELHLRHVAFRKFPAFKGPKIPAHEGAYLKKICPAKPDGREDALLKEASLAPRGGAILKKLVPLLRDGRDGRMRESPDTTQDRQLNVPVEVALVAVAEPLVPSVESVVGARPRQPDVPGGIRVTTVENFREGTAFTLKGLCTAMNGVIFKEGVKPPLGHATAVSTRHQRNSVVCVSDPEQSRLEPETQALLWK